jgi:hypothetical protein
MGSNGIEFIADTPELDGYMIEPLGTAVFTSGFERYVTP